MTEAEQIKALEARAAELTERVNELDALVYFVRTDMEDFRRAALMQSATLKQGSIGNDRTN